MYRRHDAAKNSQYTRQISRGARWVLLASFMLVATVSPARAQWTQSWSDEFNGPAGSFPDPANWTYDVGGGGWGNAELEVYCAAGSNAAPCNAATPNVFMDGSGNLVIRAMTTPSGTWTSTRMKTEGLQQFQYGRIEARIKLTVGDGLWPAFWMLGTNIGSVGWPNCGESDIMEWVPLPPPITGRVIPVGAESARASSFRIVVRSMIRATTHTAWCGRHMRCNSTGTTGQSLF